MDKLIHIKANDNYYVPYKGEVVLQPYLYQVFDIKIHKEGLFYELDVHDHFIRSTDRTKPNCKIFLYPASIQEAKFKI